MTEQEGPKRPKLSFFETFHAAAGPYRRVFSYVRPYRSRFILGLALGIGFGVLTSLLPLVVAQVSSVIFHGTVINPRTLIKHRELLTTGPELRSIAWVCLASR